MSATMTTPLGTSNMRTSLKQTRTNPTRTSKTVGSSLRQNTGISGASVAGPAAAQHGFYPAIMHFTDAVTALPREFRRHTSLLKEVDAKAWAPETNLQTLLASCVAPNGQVSLPDQAKFILNPTDIASSQSHGLHPHLDAGTNTQYGGDTVIQPLGQPLRHRKLFYDLRGTLSEMMVSMDEKNHLINGANEDLSKHLKRLTTVYPHVADEVSEEARLGSLTHWAYVENRVSTRVTAASSRREAAAGLAAMHDTDVASRSETRREAMLARKLRQHQAESDFDDTKAPKRPNLNGKAKRAVVETRLEQVSGLGISGIPPVAKRKRADKPAGPPAVDLSVGGIGAGRASSREPSQQEGAKKRKAPAPNATTAARKRIHAANSATNSPNLASSPLVGSNGKEIHRNSPIPVNARAQPARARQNSTQSRPASAASNKPNANVNANVSTNGNGNGNGNGAVAITSEILNISTTMGKAAAETRNTTKEPPSSKGDRLVEEARKSTNGVVNINRGGVLLERSASKVGVSDPKREAAAAETSSFRSIKVTTPQQRPALVSVKADVALPGAEAQREPRPSRARSSKNTTPTVITFAEAEMSNSRDHASQNVEPKAKRQSSSSLRSNRNRDLLHDSLSPSGLPPKRSHKKGAGLAAQVAALQAKQATQTHKKGQKADPNSSVDSSQGDAQISDRHTASSPVLSYSPSTYHSIDEPSLPRIDSNTTNRPSTDQPANHDIDVHDKETNINDDNTTAVTEPNDKANDMEHRHNQEDNNNDNNENNDNDNDMDMDNENKNENDNDADNDDEDEALDSSGEEPRYCYCRQVSYGEMVACDADDCAREWFHLGCVGLERAPGRNAKWFCEECKVRLVGAGAGAGAVGIIAAKPGPSGDGGGGGGGGDGETNGHGNINGTTSGVGVKSGNDDIGDGNTGGQDTAKMGD